MLTIIQITSAFPSPVKQRAMLQLLCCST